MSVPISATTATPAPDYPVSFQYSNREYLQSDGLSITAKLPDAYMIHLARTQAGVNLDAADMTDGDVVDRLIKDYELVATTAITITEVTPYPFPNRWRSYVNPTGTAVITFTDDDGQTHTMTIVCDIALDYAMIVDTADRSGYGQSLGLSPEQIQVLEGLTTPESVAAYLNTQCKQAPLVTTDLKWKIAEII